jgi:hypothetical protein
MATRKTGGVLPGRLLARVYGALAQAGDPDVVAALADARRQVQAELEISSDWRDTELAGLGEWAAMTVLAATGSVPFLDPEHATSAVPQPSRPQIAGLTGREDWYFVGRRPEHVGLTPVPTASGEIRPPVRASRITQTIGSRPTGGPGHWVTLLGLPGLALSYRAAAAAAR